MRRGTLRYLCFAVWGAAWIVQPYRWSHASPENDWNVLRYGGKALFGIEPFFHSGPLHIYAQHPEIQVGPPGLALTGVCQWLFGRHGGTGGDLAVAVLLVASGVAAVAAIDRLTDTRWSWLATLPALAVWCWGFGGWGHIEDALALTALLWAMVAVRADRAWLAGAVFGVGVAAKPWLIVAVPILLGLRTQVRSRAAVAAVGAAALPWLPFLAADPHTMRVGTVYWHVLDGSTLHALGMPVGSLLPSGFRLAQFALAVAFAAVVARRSWAAVPLAAIAVRVLLDPVAWPYYSVGPVLAAALLDAAQRRRVPVWTTVTIAVQVGVPYLAPSLYGYAQLVWAVSVVLALLVLLPHPEPVTSDGRRLAVLRVGTEPDSGRGETERRPGQDRREPTPVADLEGDVRRGRVDDLQVGGHPA